MPSGAVHVSPRLQALVEKGLFDSFPLTFSAYSFEQLSGWSLLFPAERDYYERLFGLLDRSGPEAVVRLFEPMRRLEVKMGVNEKTWPKRRFTLEQVDFLNRNPLYPEWRAAIAQVFATLDPILDREVARKGRARLVVVIAPADLPVGPDRMWTRIARHGYRILVEPPPNPGDYIPLLLRGGRAGKSIAELCAREPFDCWVVEAGAGLGTSAAAGSKCVYLSYAALDAYRKRLMREVNHVVRSEDVRGPRQLSARLKELKVLPSEAALAGDATLAEFTRATLLSGNGTLLLNNTFVEWASVQAVRRARPAVVIAGFGIRNKVKPFSSLLIFADQDAVTPIPSQADTLGSYVDLEIFYQYIWQEFEKYGEYRSNTAYLFVADGMEEMFVIAPPDFPIAKRDKPLPLAGVFEAMRAWMAA